MGAQQATLVPAVMFLVWVFTRVGLPRGWAPFLALVLGVAGGIGLNPGNPVQGALDGIMTAAAAVGFNSGVRNTVNAMRTKS